MKKIFMLSLLGLLMGCQSSQTNSEQNQDRSPSSTGLSYYGTCGRISLPESNQVARDVGDTNFAIKLDCNMDKQITKKDGRKFLMIPSYSINNENRRWLVNQKRALVSTTKNPNANPYVCVKVRASADPCGQNKPVLGFSPVFSAVK